MKNILLLSLYPQGSQNQLALWYLKAYLLKYIQKNTLLNVTILTYPIYENNEFILQRIYERKPDIIGFSCYLWNIENILKISSLIKELMPQVKVVLGGPEVSARAKELLKNNPHLDVIVRGEGEEAFKELVEFFLFGTGSIKSIKGIAYQSNDKVIENEPRLEIVDLDTIPSPYLEGLVDIKINTIIPIETSRGCIYKCHYCYYHKGFKSIRYFSLDRVTRELKLLLDKEAREIYIMDPTFNLDRKRAKHILRIIIENNKNSHLHVELKAEFLDKEMVDLLYKAKTNFIEIGVQSTNKETLKLINRDFEPIAFKRNIAFLNQKKIHYQVQLIDGLPADNYSHLKKSLDWLLNLHPAEICIMRLSLLPGSYLRKYAEKFKIKYGPSPPYYSFKSNTYSFADLIKTQDLRIAMAILYDAGLLRKSLYVISDELRIGPARIFEEWIVWITKRYSFIQKYFKRENLDDIEGIMVLKKIGDSIYEFIGYLCNKYGSSYGAAGRISSQAKYDRAVFLKNKGFEKAIKKSLDR